MSEGGVNYPPLIQLPGQIVRPPTGFAPANDAQLQYIRASEPNVFLWGNRGGGKSVTARWTCHALALSHPGYRYAILRTSFPELRLNHLIYLEAEMKALGGDYHASHFIARYPNGSKGFFFQAETEEQVKNALGIEVFCCVFDEAPTFKWDHMQMIASSVRVPPNSGLVPMKRYLGNPIGPCIDDLFRYFVDKDVDRLEDRTYMPDEWRSIRIDLKDNPHLDVEAYQKQLGSGLPEHIRKAWLDGEKFDYGQLFEVDKRKHIVHEMPMVNGKPIIYFDHEQRRWIHPEWVRIFRAYDHGYWPDPAVCLWFAQFGKQTICFKEMVRYKRVAEELAKEIAGESVGMKVTATYCDPTLQIQTGADVITIADRFEQNGVPMEPSINNREHYASAINSALKTEVEPDVPMFVMYQPGCPYLAKSLPQMRYDEKRPLAMADHKHDHAPVASAYYLMSQIFRPEKIAVTNHIPKWMKKAGYKHARLGAGNIRKAS